MAARQRRLIPGQVLGLLVLVALVATACGPSAPALTDPVEILQKGAASLGGMKSFHLRGTIDGEVPLSIGGGAGGAPISLEGTTIDGDVDAGSRALAVTIMVPALFNLKADVLVAGGSAYLKAALITNNRWVHQQAAGGMGGDPAAALAGLATFLARPELRPEKLADARCAGADCYMVRFAVPASEARDALGTLGSGIPGLSGTTVGDVTLTVGVRRDSLQLVTLGLEIPAGGKAPLAIHLEISKVNEPVTITPPPAD